MKRIAISIITLLGAFLPWLWFSEICAAASGNPNETGQGITLSPMLDSATLDDGYGMIPFRVENNGIQSVRIIWQRSGAVPLMTFTDSNTRITVARFSGQPNFTGFPGVHPPPVLLNPGETGTFNSPYSMNILAFVAAKHKEIFGGLKGEIVGSNQKFESFSDPFPVPGNLAKPPWVDLGETNYFSVKADLTKGYVNGGTLPDRVDLSEPDYADRIKSGWAEYILFPVEITNTTGQPYVAAPDSVGFYIAGDSSKRSAPSPWETIKTSEPILKPGESAISSGRCYIRLRDLESQGYKQGDKMVAAVGGRVPNTNQVFECYSAPFELPPLPKSGPPK